ncbi:N(5)-(carboxyethyl)ornithine synthase [Nocardioides sp. cx-173]|uniref:N(5)-(carboxyethyl)ornithine synthase n=1 Tax=Nocardioides sp. cx-173 TaxID=2898796 RepID=UPI001E40AF69|nr:N(5)-(carboxyethyl)ornithine synthase [Nocardioides sp. cx-173]MCD4525149.1 N(5)-(carboxyethyl)ornithine synthase [Nocardioides sp. cx-173]UGB40150.1 N(5)-(carboxyethyl)ornithine synthase [Nocardioides sp. cx-173]
MGDALLGLGAVGTSAKENELRLPLHPGHLEGMDADLRARTTLQTGYGERFGYSDSDLSGLVGGFASRDELLATSDVVLLPKPQLADVEALSPGQTLWGWPHCVQDTAVTQAAIDRQLTLIAFEAMNHWTHEGAVGLHVFHKNNELAGYSSVIHAMQLAGITGDYGRRLSAIVIGFGATARGAVTALNAHGVHEVAVLTTRGVTAVGSPIHSVRIRHLDQDPDDPGLLSVITERGRKPLPAYLAENDIVVNCTLQDTAAPVTYLRTDDLRAFRKGSLIVDVSCDLGMGFEWARPTGFDDPTFEVGDHVLYYAVDHSPSYLWGSATWDNSSATLPFVRTVLEGPESWAADETISRAIEIREGAVVNPAILAFQNRSATPPYALLG